MEQIKDYGLNFKWEILGLHKYTGTDIENAVIALSWIVNGTNEDGIFGAYFGDSNFNVSSINDEEFVSYEDLTEEIVLKWVKDDVDLTSSYWDSILEHIISEIRVKSEAIISIDKDNLPWSPISGSVTDVEVNGSI